MNSTIPVEKRRQIAPLLLVPSAVLGAIALILLRLHYQPPEVPPYTLDASPNDGALHRGERIEIDLRPERPVQGAIAARCFLVRGDDVRPWDPPFSVALDGTVEISGAVESLFAGVADGPWEIALAVGRPEVLPTAPTDVLRARSSTAGPAGWHLLRRAIQLDL